MNDLTTGLKLKAKTVISGMYDLYEDTFQLRPSLIPPRGLNYNDFFAKRRTAYLEDFQATGKGAAEILKTETGMKPGSKVIDLGSGLGRLARPLVDYLKDGGSYAGYDIVIPAVQWCRKSYAAHSNFAFHVIPTQDTTNHYAAMDPRFQKILGGENIHNGPVNPDHIFHEADASVDQVFSFSVFTHLFEQQVVEYLKETYRVLKPGACSYHTTFLVDARSQAAIHEGRATHRFPFEKPAGTFFDSEEFPLNTVGYATRKALDLYVQAGFSRENLRIILGSWSDQTLKSGSRYYQDAIVATKR
jgi:cyclopropane fatty-acyl-phospholipid synthase-like methyltransferase